MENKKNNNGLAALIVVIFAVIGGAITDIERHDRNCLNRHFTILAGKSQNRQQCQKEDSFHITD